MSGGAGLPEGVIGPVRMVFLDLDGTALNDQEQLSAQTLKALELLRAHGIPYTFASARPASMMGIYCHQAKVDGPIITLEGAEIRIWKTGSVLWSTPIEKRLAVELMEFCHLLNVDYTFYTSEAAYFRQDSARLSRFRSYNERADKLALLPVSCQCYQAYPPRFIASRQLLKVCAVSQDAEALEKLTAFVQRHPALQAELSETSTVSIVSRTASKAAAVRLFCEMQDIPLRDICCFGDYHNDTGMLRQAGYSVAMGNAPEAVKAAARYVTCSNKDDGVASFIRQYIIPAAEDRRANPLTG